MSNEELIEARKALGDLLHRAVMYGKKLPNSGERDAWIDSVLNEFPDPARAVFAVFEKAHAPTDDERTPEFEALEQELFKHQPVLSMIDGHIAGCQCMDRVFHKSAEDWGTHLAEVFEALRRPEVPESQIECPHWEPGRITLRKGCTACAAESRVPEPQGEPSAAGDALLRAVMDALGIRYDQDPVIEARRIATTLAAGVVAEEPSDALIAEVKTLRNVAATYDGNFPCDGGCGWDTGPEETCSRHGRAPKELWELVEAGYRSEAKLREAEAVVSDALGFIDQTVYENEDSSPRLMWQNIGVLELLAEIRGKLTGSEEKP